MQVLQVLAVCNMNCYNRNGGIKYKLHLWPLTVVSTNISMCFSAVKARKPVGCSYKIKDEELSFFRDGIVVPVASRDVGCLNNLFILQPHSHRPPTRTRHHPRGQCRLPFPIRLDHRVFVHQEVRRVSTTIVILNLCFVVCVVMKFIKYFDASSLVRRQGFSVACRYNK